MNTLLNVRIHITTYIFMFFAFLTGMFKDFIIVFIIILVHEIGHFIPSAIFKWNFDRIDIYPFGGCIRFNEKLSKPIFQEIVILLGGPILQLCCFFIVFLLFKNNIILYKTYIIFKKYNISILVFNLLPLYPLDGGRILNVFFNNLFPYKKGNIYIIFLSMLFIVFFMVSFKLYDYSYFLVGSILFIEIINYYKNQNFLYNKLLLEKYLYGTNYKKLKIVEPNNFYKSKRHIIRINNKYLTEKEYLNERYKR